MTSDKCYAERSDAHPHGEGDPLGGVDPYAASKSCAEIIVHSYRESFFNPAEGETSTALLASVRAGKGYKSTGAPSLQRMI